MTTPDLSRAVWHKSARSSGNGGQCVEVADAGEHGIAVRDSKNPSGPALLFATEQWDAFIGGAKSGEFDR